MSVPGMRGFFLPVLLAASLALIHIDVGPTKRGRIIPRLHQQGINRVGLCENAGYFLSPRCFQTRGFIAEGDAGLFAIRCTNENRTTGSKTSTSRTTCCLPNEPPMPRDWVGTG